MSKNSIVDVAKYAGVSTATVSHVINNTKQVLPETKKKVEEAIQALGYKPNMVARSFKTGKKYLVAFIVPDIANQFFSTLIEEIETILAQKGYRLMILNTKETKSRELSSIDAVANGVVDGMIIASTMENYKELKNTLPENLPTVFIDRKLPDCPRSTITVNCYDATCSGIEYLINKGHKRIGFITGLSRISTTMERLQAYENTMKNNGLYDKTIIKVGNSMSHCVEEHLASLVQSKCTAIVIANNIMATEAMNLLLKAGVNPGRDIELLGFKDSELAQYGLQHMSLVCQPTAELGKIAGRQILSQMEDSSSPVISLVLNAIFKARE